MKDGAAAAAEFADILNHRGEVPASMLFPLAHLGTARAALLRNDAAAARTASEEFLRLWMGADPDLRLLEEARRAHARPQ
jgi:hypothetical protein